MNRAAQSGNVLFLILIAVALFAALSYAVTQSSRSGGGTVSKEKLELQAGELIAFGGTVKSVVDKLRVSGCSDTQISVQGPVTSLIKKSPSTGDNNLAYTNPNAPSNGSCNIFDKRGGGLVFPTISPGVQVAGKLFIGDHNKSNFYFFNANNRLQWIGIDSEADLFMMVPFITKDLCDLINEKNGISGPIATNLDINNNNAYTGTYNGWNFFHSSFSGKATGCVEESTGNYYFYQVILAR